MEGAKVYPFQPAAPAPDVSEDTIATAFVNTYAASLRYDHDAGRWYEWDGARWRPDRKERGFHYAREIGRKMGEGKRQLCKAGTAMGAEKFCRADPAMAVTSEHWDCDLMLLGTPGGIVDLRTGDLQPSDPAKFITKLVAATPAPGEPKRWLSFLADATGDDADAIAYLKAWCGYCLTGDTREHSLLFAYGSGGNGKSVFINTVSGILGDYAMTAAMDTFTASRGDKHSTDVAMLKGARLVTASETEEGRAWAEAKIKQMTGADPITARFMRRDNFTFIPQFKLTIVGNHAPVLHNVDEAMRRRFRIIPFDRKPERPDRLLEEKLRAEWPHILAWMIEGCLEWLDGGLPRPASMTAATEAYFESQDVFGQWIVDNCETGRREWDAVGKLFADWVAYAKASGEEAGSNKKFAGVMQRRGFAADKLTGSDRTRIWRGIALKKKHNYDDDQGYSS